jgi:hypothetical protein
MSIQAKILLLLLLYPSEKYNNIDQYTESNPYQNLINCNHLQ